MERNQRREGETETKEDNRMKEEGKGWWRKKKKNRNGWMVKKEDGYRERGREGGGRRECVHQGFWRHCNTYRLFPSA